jgi:hypothetical protein
VEDFSSSLVSLSQTDNSTKKVINLIAKQASNPALATEYTVTSVSAKDFLFGRIINVEITQDGTRYSALVYHDHSSEQAQLLSWGASGELSNCNTKTGSRCEACV